MSSSGPDVSYASAEENCDKPNDGVQKPVPGLNIRSRSINSILMEASLSSGDQKEIKELFSRLKSEYEKVDSSEAQLLEFTIQLLDKIINGRNLCSKTVTQLLEKLVIENLQVDSLIKLLKKCLEEIRKDVKETCDYWGSVIGRVLSTIQKVETFKTDDLQERLRCPIQKGVNLRFLKTLTSD